MGYEPTDWVKREPFMLRVRPLIGVSTSELREARTVRPLAQGEPRQHEIALGLDYPEAVDNARRPAGHPAPDRARGRGRRSSAASPASCSPAGPTCTRARTAPPWPATSARPSPSSTTSSSPSLREADARGMPILAICRGMQALNVAREGTLHQHLPDVVGTDIDHRQAGAGSRPTHWISLQEGSGLATTLGRGRSKVNSFHHQAIQRLGTGLTEVGVGRRRDHRGRRGPRAAVRLRRPVARRVAGPPARAPCPVRGLRGRVQALRAQSAAVRARGLTAARAGQEGVGERGDEAGETRLVAGDLELAVGAGAGGERADALQLGHAPERLGVGRADLQQLVELGSRAGTRRSRAGSISRASMPSRAARKRFSTSTSGAWPRGPDRAAPRPRSAGDALHERASAAVSSTLVCASMIRTSTVPKRGCGRTSHHRNVGSGIAPQRMSRSTAST